MTTVEGLSKRGTITEIQRYCIHDGPGIRTTVFLKGCNLRCFWCHNPETLAREPELQVFPERCIDCGACILACPCGALERTEAGKVLVRERCTGCGRCAAECFAEALVMVGHEVSAGEVLLEVLADRAFFQSSGGGVTLSGGEPLLQAEFSAALLSACQADGIHTAIETAGHVPWDRFATVLPAVDLLMLDLKVMDCELHRRVTGVSNATILENAQRLGAGPLPLVIRIPVIPGVNDTAEAIGSIARFASGLPALQHLELLPFHPMAAGKYDSLGLTYSARSLARPSPERMAALADVVASFSVPVRASSA
ncbi:MAG: glycyl-radical enzyme activating protein [Chloroflexi bacterium]|nr:glycyl-radical enzyme activating protein [Chloroflexota bacterium]